MEGWCSSIGRSTKEIIISTSLVILIIFGGALGIYLIEQGQQGTLTNNEKRSTSQWTYLNAVYFSVVTITTIGYGDFVPTTDGGKVWVVFQTIFGIGVFALALSTLSRNMFVLIDTKIEESITQAKNKQNQKKEEKDTSLGYRLQKNRRYIFAGLIYVGLIFAGAAVFNALESLPDGTHWGYGNALYFCIVTLATVGYGDFVPKTDGGKIFLIFYVFIGFGIFSFLLTDLARKFVRRIQKQMERRMREVSLLDLEVDELEMNKVVPSTVKTSKDIVDQLRVNVNGFLTMVDYTTHDTDELVAGLEEILNDLKDNE